MEFWLELDVFLSIWLMEHRLTTSEKCCLWFLNAFCIVLITFPRCCIIFYEQKIASEQDFSDSARSLGNCSTSPFHSEAIVDRWIHRWKHVYPSGADGYTTFFETCRWSAILWTQHRMVWKLSRPTAASPDPQSKVSCAVLPSSHRQAKSMWLCVAAGTKIPIP